MSGKTPRQLPLALPHAPEYGRESFFVAPSNQAAYALTTRWPDWPAPVVVLSGPPGSGKTHLAHIWAEQAGATWLDAADMDGSKPANIKHGSGYVVDDADRVGLSERGLFHLINGVMENRSSLLLTARAPSVEWAISLPDLRSRLRLAAPAMLETPGDGLLRKVMVKLFTDRQLGVDQPVVEYLMSRMERSLSAAVRIVDSLDQAALASGSRITRPLAGKVLAWAERDDAVFPDR